jgi:hypothetical protein
MNTDNISNAIERLTQLDGELQKLMSQQERDYAKDFKSFASVGMFEEMRLEVYKNYRMILDRFEDVLTMIDSDNYEKGGLWDTFWRETEPVIAREWFTRGAVFGILFLGELSGVVDTDGFLTGKMPMRDTGAQERVPKADNSK